MRPMVSAGFLRRVLLAALLVFSVITVVAPPVVHAQAQAAVNDPTGASAGAAKDVTVKDPKAPTLEEVMDTVGRNKVAINFVWTLITGFIVMFMQAGFAMVETGFTRARKRVAHHEHELHGSSAGHVRLLDLRLRARADGRPWCDGDSRRRRTART